MVFALPLVLSLLNATPAASASAPEAPTAGMSQDPRRALLQTMSTELERNRKGLKLDKHEAPYFISYQMKDTETVSLAGRFGALFANDDFRDRRLFVDVRVGNYEFDNSLDESLDFSFSTKGTSYIAEKVGPLDDDSQALRASLWLVTDERYKAALFNYLKKKGENVYAVDDPKRPFSFSKEKAEKHADNPLKFAFDRERWKKEVRELSALFNANPDIFDAQVTVTGTKTVRYFVSTEGSRLITEDMLYGVHVTGVTRATDGQLIEDSKDFYSPLEGTLPSHEVLTQATKELISGLMALRAAPAIDPYTGPAILAPEAAGVLFHEAVGHRLEGERQNDDNEGKTFRGQVGVKMLPSFISIIDDPNLTKLAGKDLNGHYDFDDQGVRGQRTVLVEKGVLRNYLLSRRPVEGDQKSNGHGRAQGGRQPMARMANLYVESAKQVDEKELKKMLIAEAKRQGKPYGLVIRDIQGGNTNTSSYGYQAFKGIPRQVFRVDVRDGKETLVRGVEIVGTPLSSINRVLATGKQIGVFNGYCGAESGNVPVSASAPATLLAEIELQRTVEGKDRPPLIPSPIGTPAK